MSVAITGAAVSRERPQRGRLADRERPLKWSSMRRPRSIDRLRLLEAEQALPHHEQIRQRAGDHEPMPILDQAAVAHLGEAEDAFDHADRMLDPRAHAGLPPIRRAPLGRRGATMDEVVRVGRAYTEHRGLARVRRIAPHAPFRAVQQPRQDVAVMDVGGRTKSPGKNKTTFSNLEMSE